MLENSLSEFLNISLEAAEAILIFSEIAAIITGVSYGLRKFMKHITLQKDEIKSYIDEKKSHTDHKIDNLQSCLNGTRNKVDLMNEETKRLRTNVDKIWLKTNEQGNKISEIWGSLTTHIQKKVN